MKVDLIKRAMMTVILINICAETSGSIPQVLSQLRLFPRPLQEDLHQLDGVRGHVCRLLQ